MAINDNTAEPRNKPKYSILSFANTLTPAFVIHKWNTKISPADSPAANNRYIV